MCIHIYIYIYILESACALKRALDSPFAAKLSAHHCGRGDRTGQGWLNPATCIAQLG